MTSTLRAGRPPARLLLPGQTAAPVGPVEVNLLYVLHHAFRRDLDDLVDGARNTPTADRRTWRALERRWSWFVRVLRFHHLAQDAALWPVLRSRADAGGRALLAGLATGRAELGPLLASGDAGFRRLAATADDDARAALVVRLVATRERLGVLLAREESEMVRLVQRVLDQQDWDDVSGVLAEELSTRRALRVLPWVVHGLPAEARAWMATRPGGRVHLAIWVLTRWRFEAAHRRTFGYVADARAA